MSLLQETKLLQQQLALYCRTGDLVNLPGTLPGRIQHYRRLIFNILLENLEAAFPILHSSCDETVWNSMVHEFFSKHPCQSYQVWNIAGEFCQVAIAEEYALKYELPYLNDLLKFEWAEMEIFNREDAKTYPPDSINDLMHDKLMLLPEQTILNLSYPVHLYRPADAQTKPGNYFVLVYRDRESCNVQFLDISVWYAFVLEQIHQRNTPLKDLLGVIPELFPNIDTQELASATVVFLEDLRNGNVVVGRLR